MIHEHSITCSRRIELHSVKLPNPMPYPVATILIHHHAWEDESKEMMTLTGEYGKG